MVTRYQIELDRNERDFATFLKSRNVSLSQNELKLLIASTLAQDHISLFDTEGFRKNLNSHKANLVRTVKDRSSRTLKT